MSDNVNVNRIAKNTMLLYIRMIVLMVISLYTSRVVLKILGVEDFGVYNVVAGVVAMFGFFNHAMTMATQRFLNVEMGKNDPDTLNRTFKMAVNIHAIVAIIVLLLSETIGIYLVNRVLNIPDDRMIAANIVFQFSAISACVVILQVPYNSLIYAREKMDFYAYISLGEAALKLLLILMLSLISWDKLILYGFLTLCIPIIFFLVYVFYSNKHFEESKYNLIWDNSIFKKMVGFIGWNILGQIAQAATIQGVNMVVNVFHGVLINAAMAVTNQVNGAITSFVNNFQTSFRPQIMKSYAANEIEEMNRLVIKSSKMSFYLLYIISIPLMFNIDIILDLWLDKVPEYSSIFCKLLIWYTYIEAIGLPLVMSIMATGQNRNYQIAISLVISLNLLLTWVFLKWGLNVATIFYIKIFVSAFGLIVRMFFANKQTQMKVKTFIHGSIMPIVYVLIITQPFYYLLRVFYNNGGSWYWLLLTVLLEVLVLISIYYVGMTRNERVFVTKGIQKFLKIKK